MTLEIAKPCRMEILRYSRQECLRYGQKQKAGQSPGLRRNNAARKSTQRLDLPHDRRGIDAVFGEQLLSFARARQFAHGKLVDPDAFRTQLPGHGVPEPALGVMLLHSDNRVVRLLRRRLDDVAA